MLAHKAPAVGECVADGPQVAFSHAEHEAQPQEFLYAVPSACKGVQVELLGALGRKDFDAPDKISSRTTLALLGF